MLIGTARLSLLPVAEADVGALHAHWTDPGVRRYLWDDLVITRERAAEVVAASAETFKASGYGLWIARLHGQTDLAGVAGLRPFDDDVELLISIATPHWRRGFGAEAAGAVLGFAFEHLRLPRVLGHTDPPNEASMALMESLGMRKVGRVVHHDHDLVGYSIEAGGPDMAPRPPEAP